MSTPTYNKMASIAIGGTNINKVSTPNGNASLDVTGNANLRNNLYVAGNITNATNDYLEKLKKSQLILEKYPDRVPIIIQPSASDRDSFPIDKSKYITPRDLTLVQLQQIIRKRIKFPAEKALFMFINNRIYPITSVIGPLYDEHKNKDGFLYVTYCQESTFGQ